MNTKMRFLQRSVHWMCMAVAAMLLFGCAHHMSLPQEPSHWVYKANGSVDSEVEKWAPAFVTYSHAADFNRIGRPSVRQTDNGNREIFIDTDQPAVYFMRRSFTTEKATYTNLIYRVHFPKVPFSLVPFNLTAGSNVGILVVVTLDADSRPVLVTSVGTCGCYKAMVPTDYLRKDAYPANWRGTRQNIYGEQLPPLLTVKAVPNPQILVYLRPAVHRVMALEVRDRRELSSAPFRLIPMPVEAMQQLEHLPADGGTTSFYYGEGVLKGHVKGSIKPFESLFMSLLSMDLFVGTDKAYGETAQSENPFYTSLKPWRRQDSNMWDFARFLHYWGWRL